MGAVESMDLSCCTPAAFLYHIRGEARASHLTFVPPAPCSFFPFFYFFLFYFLEAQDESGERGVKCGGKMLINGISNKLLKDEESHSYEGWCKCVD